MSKFDGSDETFDAILTKVEVREKRNNPNVQRVVSCVLKDGPRTAKLVSVLYIHHDKTGEFHHHSLVFEHFQKKNEAWVLEEETRFYLEDKQNNEIKRLFDFLANYDQISIQGHGDYAIIRDDELKGGRIRQIIDAISDQQKIGLISQLLSLAESDSSTKNALVELAVNQPQKSRFLATALNVGRFSEALDQLKRLIEEDALERQFQSLLQNNPWMFGTEYSRVLDKRSIFADEEVDFFLQRTADNCLEIVEIKRPLNDIPLFGIDSGHGSLYPKGELSKVIGQTI